MIASRREDRGREDRRRSSKEVPMKVPTGVEDMGTKAIGRGGDRTIFERLSGWRHYSVVFGLVMPVVCFALEFVLLPALGWVPGLIFFHRFRLFGYGVIVLELITLGIWLRFGPRLGRASAGFAGVLLAGALFAGVLGLVLLPFAIPGVLVLGIGALGFVPLFTANVYYRQGLAAYRQAVARLDELSPDQADPQVARRSMFEALLWGAILVYALPGLIQARLSLTTRAALREAISGDDLTSRAAVDRLRPYWWVADFDPMRRAYRQERDQSRRKRLSQDYRRLTGGDIWAGPDRLFEYDGPDRLIED
jgi:hypothetical protein